MKIYIKGFKSIKDGQHVALGRRLTFLVGPNSAGKSAVMMALQKLKGDTPAFELDESLVHRNPNKDSEVSASHSLGVEWKHKSDTLGYYGTYCSKDLYYQQASSERDLNLHEITDSMTEYDFVNESKHFYFSHYQNGNSILTVGGSTTPAGEDFKATSTSGIGLSFWRAFDGFETVSVDLNCIETTTAIRLSNAMKWLLSIHESYARELLLKPDKGSISNRQKQNEMENWTRAEKYQRERIQLIRSLLVKNLLKWNVTEIRFLIRALLSGKDRQRVLNIFENYNAQVQRYRKSVEQKYLQAYPGAAFDVSLVSAGRTLPVNADLHVNIKYESSGNAFHELMKSHIKKEWHKKCDIKFQNSFIFSPKSDELSLLESINKALSENLFLDNAYQIHVESKMLVSTDEWNQQEIGDDDEPEFLAKMYLMDAHGRKLKFDEVGSGIGYVLPVLMESLNPSNKGKVVFLQQPELHLHPALQASLTDVLVEASANKRIVAETHSEHMILRALKRVRQTTNGTLKDPELRLKPHDIAVNYFEPMPDGSTRVHILRVSDDGDFLDRWPNGFFAERDLELFDE